MDYNNVINHKIITWASFLSCEQLREPGSHAEKNNFLTLLLNYKWIFLKQRQFCWKNINVGSAPDCERCHSITHWAPHHDYNSCVIIRDGGIRLDLLILWYLAILQRAFFMSVIHESFWYYFRSRGGNSEFRCVVRVACYSLIKSKQWDGRSSVIVAVNKGETTQRVVKRAGAKARPHTEQFKIVSSRGWAKRPASF